MWRFRAAEASRLWLLAGLLLAFLPHLERLPLLVILASGGLLLWRLAFELRFADLPSRVARLLLTGLAILITFAAFDTLVGREPGVALLVVMLCLKLMEMKSGRDVVVVIGLGYFVVVTVFLFDQSILMGLYMLLAVVLLTTALTAFSRANSRLPERENLRAAAVMLAEAAPMMLLMFVLFPRIPGPLWNLPDEGAAAVTGLSDTLSPGNISRLTDNDAVAFRVQFDDGVPPPGELYWRGPVLTQFDGRTWSNPANAPHRPRLSREQSYQALGEPVRYTLTLQPHEQHWLFALDLPAELPDASTLSPDFEIIANRAVTQLQRYTIRSYPNYRLDVFSPPSGIYLQLPADSAYRARRLAAEWRDELRNPGQVVQRALDYFRDQPFYYTRNPPLLGGDPVDEFLFGSRRGFCEHYASSFVVLMRAAGIPARVTTGYQGGEVNPLGDYFIVRQSDAHAWAEVWLRDQGWVRIDPTAAIPATRIEAQADLARIVPEAAVLRGEVPGWATRLWRQFGYGWDNLNHYWNQWIIGYDQRLQTAFLSKLGLGDLDWRGMVTLLFAGLGVVVAVIAFRLFRQHRQVRDPVVLAYRRFCRKLARRGLARRPAETAGDFAARAKRARPDLAAQVQVITTLYQSLRYARRPALDGLRRLRRAIRKFRPGP